MTGACYDNIDTRNLNLACINAAVLALHFSISNLLQSMMIRPILNVWAVYFSFIVTLVTTNFKCLLCPILYRRPPTL